MSMLHSLISVLICIFILHSGVDGLSISEDNVLFGADSKLQKRDMSALFGYGSPLNVSSFLRSASPLQFLPGNMLNNQPAQQSPQSSSTSQTPTARNLNNSPYGNGNNYPQLPNIPSSLTPQQTSYAPYNEYPYQAVQPTNNMYYPHQYQTNPPNQMMSNSPYYNSVPQYPQYPTVPNSNQYPTSSYGQLPSPSTSYTQSYSNINGVPRESITVQHLPDTYYNGNLNQIPSSPISSMNNDLQRNLNKISPEVPSSYPYLHASNDELLQNKPGLINPSPPVPINTNHGPPTSGRIPDLIPFEPHKSFAITDHLNKIQTEISQILPNGLPNPFPQGSTLLLPASGPSFAMPTIGEPNKMNHNLPIQQPNTVLSALTENKPRISSVDDLISKTTPSAGNNLIVDNPLLAGLNMLGPNIMNNVLSSIASTVHAPLRMVQSMLKTITDNLPNIQIYDQLKLALAISGGAIRGLEETLHMNSGDTKQNFRRDTTSIAGLNNIPLLPAPIIREVQQAIEINIPIGVSEEKKQKFTKEILDNIRVELTPQLHYLTNNGYVW